MNNIRIAYLLSFLWRSWFWLGVWVFYYLRFTDYAGIGLLEAIMVTVATVGEIPSGVIADILGKKPVIILAFILAAIGNILMAIAPNYSVLIISIMIMTFGGTLYSGSMEALVFDTLKEKCLEGKFDKVLGRMTSMQNLGMAVAGITGGFLYKMNVSLPFLAVAGCYFMGAILSLFLVEPKIDSEKHSLKQFILQNTEGFRELFASKKLTMLVLALLIPGSFMIATENVINDASAVELGFDSVGLGIFTTILYLSGVFISEKTEWINKKFSTKNIYIGTIGIYILTLLLIPKTAIIAGALLLLIRHMFQTFFGNYQSIRINAFISSKYRATTLSTYSLIRNIPYVLFATSIGVMMNIHTAKLFSFYLGVVLILCLAGFFGVQRLLRTKI